MADNDDCFNDIEDSFFSEINLDEIIALESQTVNNVKGKGSTTKISTDVGHQHQQRFPSTSSTSVPKTTTKLALKISANCFEGDKDGNLPKHDGSDESTPLSSKKKRFKFFKSVSTTPSSSNFKPPSPIPDVSMLMDDIGEGEWDDWDDVEPLPPPKPTEPKPRKIPIELDVSFEVKAARYGKDAPRNVEWRKFTEDMEKQPQFEWPPFQTIPVTALNIARGKSIISSARDISHLIQFAKILLSILEKMSADVSSKREGVPSGKLDMWYYTELIKLMDTTFYKIDSILTENEENASSPSQTDMMELFKTLLQGHYAGKLDLCETSILPFVVKYYPSGFQEILEHAHKTGNVDLLVDICSGKQKNFVIIVNHLLLLKASAEMEDDPNFQLHSKKYDTETPENLVMKLIKSLFCKLGGNAVKCFPVQFQALITFENAISSLPNAKLFSNSKMTSEIFNLVNELICQRGLVDEKLFTFFIWNLYHTSAILADKNVIQTVRYKQWPYLWKYLRELR